MDFVEFIDAEMSNEQMRLDRERIGLFYCGVGRLITMEK
jgi:hypothetical protein